MLEFSDDLEEEEIKINIIKIPQEPDFIPCLRVGQSLSAIIPKLQVIQPNVVLDAGSTGSTTGSTTSNTATHVDDGYPASPR